MDWKNPILILAILVVWFSLNRWILPWFGFATCMSGSCASLGPPVASIEKSTTPPVLEKESTSVIHLTDSNFQAEVLQTNKPVLVDFWAPWCGPCRMIGPVVEDLAAENAGKAKVAKVNVDESPATASAYGITSIPTLMIFKDGKPIDQFVGLQSKAQLQAALDQAKP